MLIDVVRPETWEELNDSIKSNLGLGPKIRARAYHGIAQSVYEISQSTAQFMAHKKSVGFIRGQTPVFESLMPYYYKELYEVNAVAHLQIGNVKEWVESLKRETCFVLFAEDHPVTGEVYPFVEELDKLLNEKRIFSFRISHARHFHEAVEIRPYTVRFCSYAQDVAVALLGERFRSPSISAQNMSWNKEEFLARLSEARAAHATNQLLIEKFESEVSAVAKPYFAAGSARLFDRAAVVFNDVSAEALAEAVFKKLGLSAEEGWRKLETTNMCQWTGVDMFRQWWEPKPSFETLRGLLLVGAELLNTKDFAKMLISSYEEIKQQQSWSV